MFDKKKKIFFCRLEKGKGIMFQRYLLEYMTDAINHPLPQTFPLEHNCKMVALF